MSTRPAAADDEDAARRVLQQFRQVFNAVKTHFQEVERTVGVGGSQVWALSVVQARPGLGVGELAKAMHIHQSTASNLVKTLQQRGLLEIERDEADRRAVRLKILADGKRLLKRSPGPFAGVLPDALAELDPRTLARMERDLAALIAVLKADKRAARIPLADM